MRLLAREKKVLCVLGATLLSAVGFFLLIHSNSVAEAIFRNNEILYAETQASAADALATTTPFFEKVSVPILVYHIVRPAYPSDSEQIRSFAQTPDIFDAQMKYLSDAGYHVVSLDALASSLRGGAPLPEHAMVLTFDDGWSDQYQYAFPILKKYGYTATFFVFTNPIGTKGFLTWDNLREMLAGGMTVGSHSLSHPYLTKITDSAILWNEISASKQTLEKNLALTVRDFAYPFGLYTASTTELVVKAGYELARGDYAKKGGNSSLYTLNAQNVPTTLELFMLRYPSVK